MKKLIPNLNPQHIVFSERHLFIASRPDASSHNRTTIRVLITKRSTRLIPKNRGMWRILMVTRSLIIVSMLVVVVGRCRLRGIISEWTIAIMLIIVMISVILVLWIVWQLPQLGPPSGLPDCLKNLLLVCPSSNSHFLCSHVYLNVIHTCAHTKPKLFRSKR